MNTFLFIIMLIVSAGTMLCFLGEVRCDVQGVKMPKIIASTRSFARSAAVFLLFIAVSSAIGLISFGSFNDGFTLMGLASALSMALCEVNRRFKTPLIRTALKAIFVASVLEVTLFNLQSYRLLFGDYPEMRFTAEQCACGEGVDYRPKENDIVVKGNKSAVFTFDGINAPVSNVFIDVYYEYNSQGASVSIDAMDETQTTIYREGIGKATTVRDKWHSQFIPLELSGNVSKLRVTVSPLTGGIIYLDGISLNLTIPMDVSWLRVFLIIALSTFFYWVVRCKSAQKSFVQNLKLCRMAAVLITAVACIIAICVTNLKLNGVEWSYLLKNTTGNQVSQELPEAFEGGSTHLLEEPTEDVVTFPNIYDKAYREANEINIKWDHVYRNGHYYSYYGIAPVILLFMPYHMLTGYCFPDQGAVLIFALIGIIGLTFVFMEFMKKLFPKTPSGISIAALVILQTVSGIWYSVGRPLFYEVAMSAGFCFMTWAVYFFFSANIISGGKISLPRTAISSLLFAVAVLSRPTLVLYCICAAVFMVLALPRAAGIKRRNEGKKKQKLLNSAGVRYLLCAIVPMACLGLCQMWYNYDRFGSPFEFGIQYSLTINDFTKAQFHPRLSLIALYNYLFNPPVFSASYPFVSTNFQFLDTNGFFYEDRISTLNSSGLFFLALPMFAFFISGRALKHMPDRKKRLTAMAYVGIPCILIPVGIIASVWESGYAVRYMVDFSWQSLLGAYAVIFYIYSKITDKTKRKLVRSFMCVSLLWALIVSGTQCMNQATRYGTENMDNPNIVYETEQLYAFWK
ncbi:MAG: hypothetical protein IJ779_04325 [Ruminococcus sp.]|nr:hypothetical protein [Ruminococcus sp.]